VTGHHGTTIAAAAHDGPACAVAPTGTGAPDVPAAAAERLAWLEARVAELTEALAVARHQLEEHDGRPDLRQAQKLESVGQLAAGVAHEINTPIQFIGDSSHFLAGVIDDLLHLVDEHRAFRDACEAELPPAQRRLRAAALAQLEDEVDLPFLREEGPAAVTRTLEGVRRVSSIVAALRQFAHPGHGALEPTDLNKVVETTLVVASNEYRYVADVHCELGDLPPVTADRDDLGQMVLNLVVNASHAIGDRSDGRRGTITVRTAAVGDDVVLEVEDTGVGIDPAISGRIYDPFFTTKEPGRGTGQGLSIISSIVRRHQGRIGFRTAPGRGTCFRVHLPKDGPR
jgi:signal transduction histidine kinase